MTADVTTTDLEGRLRRLEDAEAIRTLDAVYCRHLDDGNWPALVELFRQQQGTSLREACARVADRLAQRRGDTPPSDDVALLAVERS